MALLWRCSGGTYPCSVPTTAYRSRRTVLPLGEQACTVVVDEATGCITAVAPYDAPPPAERTVDLAEHALLPGLVDPHVHINEPGRTHWEGFDTATRAAAAGGVTTVVDMPLNNLPETTTVAALALKRAAAHGKTHVDWRAWGGAVGDATDGNPGNPEHLEPLAQAGVPGFKCFLLYPGCEGLGLIDERALRAALPHIARVGLPLLVHAELAGPCDAAAATLRTAGADWTRYETYLASRPDEAEVAAVRMMIGLCREFGAWVHIVHVSSAAVLPLLRAAKAEGLPLTAETCPHYLAFTAEDIASLASHRTLYKCAPPIRGRANQALLWQALYDGTLDLIASDHSPCPPEMKGLEAGDFATAWGGIASLSLGLPAVWTAMQTATTAGAPDLASETWVPPTPTLSSLSTWMSTNPSRLAGLSTIKGSIEPGKHADLVVFAPDERFTVRESDLHFRHAISPYLGRTLQGVVKQTILRGAVIYDHGRFPHPCSGREMRP